MVAAAATLWLLFALWLIGEHVGMPARPRCVLMVLLCAELFALMAWSYGTQFCAERTCAPLAQGLGVVARIDLPLIALVVAVLAVRATARTTSLEEERRLTRS